MLKVAHVFKSLAAGGIEKWLTDVAIDNSEKKRFDLTFLLQSKDFGFFEEQVQNTSVNVKKMDLRRSFIKYLYDLFLEFRNGKYDVVHSHVHHFSGIVMLVAFLAGVKIRVAQSHNDKREEYKDVSLKKKTYFIVCKLLLQIFANKKIAVSDNAAESLFPYSKKVHILPCGLRLNIPQGNNKTKGNSPKIVIGHIGSFSPQKNHKFICELAQNLELNYPNRFEFQLVGGGGLYQSIVEKVKQLNLEKTVKFLGLRKDVPSLIYNEFDIVILPSLHEGLAMVALEAQYYGKPLIVSDSLSKQHTLSSYIQYESISNVNAFKNAILSSKEPTEYEVISCRDSLNSSPLSVSHNIKMLIQIYST
ncbi:glycosyltransferase [Pseudoalteromonas shioyasakiensis]|uniref:glycosyltransferase n=1 Tax=Pseudoalteromonas shioyasakiensis TaxID=1190813 RepID=UPI0025520AFF|nr:glycosyltransferase [Pseudoalteromonas shioyasakiensis]MDK9684923.1 glycosyltransferase [Pseudoalteromonas shioyasakiensis]